MSNVLRNLPSVGELLESPPLKSLVRRVNRNVVVTRARQFLDRMRGQLQSAASSVHVPSASELAALSRGSEVVVSRGQLMQLDDNYRLSELIAVSGAVLRDVGTTNETSLADYAAAVSDRTGALMRVHTSNFTIVGCTQQPSFL